MNKTPGEMLAHFTPRWLFVLPNSITDHIIMNDRKKTQPTGNKQINLLIKTKPNLTLLLTSPLTLVGQANQQVNK